MTIYETPIRGRTHFTLCWYEGTVRKRKLFADPAKAHQEGQIRLTSLAHGETEILRLSGIERLEHLRAKECLMEFNTPLDVAASEYQLARRILKGVPLMEAVRHFSQSRLVDIPRKTVDEVVCEILGAKRDEGLSERYLRDLAGCLKGFANAFQCDLLSVTGNLIRTWLQEKKVGNRTRNNLRTGIQTLVSFAKSRKYLPLDWNELAAVPIRKEASCEVEIFTPEELAELLLASEKEPSIQIFVAIGAFAGLRSAEIERLDWGDIDLESGYIKVTADKSKTGSRRLVPIPENLGCWLRPRAERHGRVVPATSTHHRIHRLVRTANALREQRANSKPFENFRWKHNALRHSYCSYRLAIVKNAAQVALEAGNSPRIIFEHYRELVTEAAASKWFALRPPRQNTICHVLASQPIVAAPPAGRTEIEVSKDQSPAESTGTAPEASEIQSPCGDRNRARQGRAVRRQPGITIC